MTKWTHPLSAYQGRPPVVSQGFRGAVHPGADLDYVARTGDPPWSGHDWEQRTRRYFAPPPGVVPVRAVADGTVVISHNLANGGSVRVTHGAGLNSLYLHLAKRNVEVNDVVKAGDVVGYMGCPRPGAFCHLHFELRREGKAVDPEREMGKGLALAAVRNEDGTPFVVPGRPAGA